MVDVPPSPSSARWPCENTQSFTLYYIFALRKSEKNAFVNWIDRSANFHTPIHRTQSNKTMYKLAFKWMASITLDLCSGSTKAHALNLVASPNRFIQLSCSNRLQNTPHSSTWLLFYVPQFCMANATSLQIKVDNKATSKVVSASHRTTASARAPIGTAVVVSIHLRWMLW